MTTSFCQPLCQLKFFIHIDKKKRKKKEKEKTSEKKKTKTRIITKYRLKK